MSTGLLTKYDIKQFLDSNKIEYKDTGKTYDIKICPECGNENYKYHIMQDDGRTGCFVCSAKGNWFQFKQKVQPSRLTMEYVKKMNEELYGAREGYNPRRLPYLEEERGLSQEIIDKYLLGYNKYYDAISIPYIEDGKVLAIKYRYIGQDTTKPRYTYEKGGQSVLFNRGLLKDSNNGTVLLLEGEFDTLSAISYGIESVVGFPGAQYKGEDLELIKQFETIYIAFDKDKAGIEAAQNLAETFGFDKCYNVDFSGEGIKDLSDCLAQGIEVEQIQQAIEEAKQFDIPGVVEVETVKDALKSNPLVPVASFPYKAIDDLMEGLYPGEVSIISGIPGLGKSSFCISLAREWALSDVGVMFCALETGKEKLTDRYLYDFKNAKLAFWEPEDLKVFTDGNKLTKYFMAFAQKHGTKVFILDHLEWVASRVSRDDNRAIGFILKVIIEACQRSRIHAILIHHLNKGVLMSTKEGKNFARKPHPQDLNFGGDREAANVLFLHRNFDTETGELSQDGWAELLLSKNRHSGQLGSVGVYFDKTKHLYKIEGE